MRIVIWSDASYLSESNARSRAGGIHYLTNVGNLVHAPVNGAVDVISSIIPTVVSSAAEAELAGLFINAQLASASLTTLRDLGYPQSAAPIITDNTTAKGIADQSVRLKRSKAIDMRYFWIRDRVKQKQFSIHWAPGPANHADYFTKTHPIKTYLDKRSIYLNPAFSPAVSYHPP